MKDLSQMETAGDLEVDDEEDVIGCLPTVLTPAHRQEIDAAVVFLPNCIGSADISKIENNLERYCKLLKLYQEQPNLLDGYIPTVVNKLLSYIQLPSSDSSIKTLSNISNAALEYLEHLTTVRGAKVISRLLPHEVVYLDKILITLENLSPIVEEGLRERRMLLLWLWIVCKNPFDMRRFDKKDSPGYTLKRILNVVEPYLTGMLSKCHRMAALVLSQCIARTDGLLLLNETISSCIQKLSSENDSLGGLILLSAVLKHVDRQHIISHVDQLVEAILPFFPLNSPNVLFRKYLVKTAQRIALTLLKPRVASWRYQRGKRSLEESLATVNNTTTSTGYLNGMEIDENDADCDVSSHVEWVLGSLLEAIKDDDTTVRWSAAKGIGRICSRLPKDLATQVVDAIVENNFHRLAGHCSWHGGCMSLAELSRRGFLLPETLPKVFEIVQSALFYEEPMGRQALGANVRDAACYILWSFARAYDPTDLRAYVDKVATSLMCVTLFDREVRLRRAASAAFQENVGRQANFPDGIALLTIVDYFAVGNRERCYLRLAKEVSFFSKYTAPIIDHLVEKKVCHWDISVRNQAANSLFYLAARQPTYVTNKLPALLEGTSTDNPIKRHGSLVALAHTVKGLLDAGWTISEEIRSTLAVIPGQLRNDFNNQRTGELTRLAVTEYIRVLSSVGLDLNQNQVNTWLSLLEAACIDKNQAFRKTAACSASIFIGNYICADSRISQEVKTKFTREIKASGLEWTRIGYCNLAGCLPAHSVDISLFEALCSTILIPTPQDKKWALAREAAVDAISIIFLTVNDDIYSPLCFESLFKALEDYTNDIHGDIGRFVRQQAMRSLTNVLTAETTPRDLKERYVPLAVKRMVQQSAEKIGRTREVACNCIAQLIKNLGTSGFVPHAETLAEVYKDGHDFIQDKVLLNLTSLFPCEEYYKDVVQGLVLSAGGVSELTGRFSTEAFLVYQDSVANDFLLIEKLLSAVADLLDQGMKNIRIGECVLRFLPQLLRRLPIDETFSDNSKGLGRIVTRLERLIANQNQPPRRLKMILSAFSSLLLLSSTSKMWNKSMKLIASNLSNPTPAMRRFAAESLLESIWATDVDESIVTLLSETPWQEMNNIDAILDAADSIQRSLAVV